MSKTPQQLGRDFEVEFAKRIGGKLVPGSGNQWHSKLDVGGRSFLWSLKLTTKESFRLSRDVLWEATRAVYGPGGKGGCSYPGVAVRVVDEDYVVLRLEDFLEIVREDIKLVAPTKREEKMQRGAVPKFNRSDNITE